jgi:CRISPR-associated protein Cas2
MNVVITYDISEDKRRTKIHKVLKSYGQWMQFSVFECDLTETQYARLRLRLNKLIKPDQDSIRFYFLCACCKDKVERIGGEQVRDDSIFFV